MTVPSVDELMLIKALSHDNGLWVYIYTEYCYKCNNNQFNSEELKAKFCKNYAKILDLAKRQFV